MKFWRRHKHELFRSADDAPLPQAPEKKMRYGHADDVLLARYFYERPEGTSDKIFQTFAREVIIYIRFCLSLLLAWDERELMMRSFVAAPASSMERMARTPSNTQGDDRSLHTEAGQGGKYRRRGATPEVV
jgi:hypothetical protein